MKKLLLMQFFLSLSFCFCSCLSTGSGLRFYRQNGQGSSALHQIANDFSMLARLVNGIALREGLSDGFADPEEVIAELLNLESGETVHNLIETKLDSELSKKLEDTVIDAEKLGVNPIRNSLEVKDGIMALESMKSYVDDLNIGATTKNANDFIEKAKKIKTATQYKSPLPFKDIQDVAERMKILRDHPLDADSLLAVRISELFQMIVKSRHQIHSVISYSVNYRTHYESILEIQGKYKTLNPIHSISTAGQAYQKSWNVFNSLAEKMNALRTDMDVLLPLSTDHKTHSDTSKSLKKVTDFVKSMSTLKMSPKSLTEGFPNGPSDLIRIKEDLNEKWLKEKIAEGKDMNKLLPYLSFLDNVGANLSIVSKEWNDFNKEKDILGITTSLLLLFETLAKDGKHIRGIKNLETTLKTLTSATSRLKPIKGSPKFSQFEAVYNFSKTLDGYSDVFKKKFENIFRNGDEGVFAAFESLVVIAETEVQRSRINNSEADDTARKCRAIQGFSQLVDVVVASNEELAPIFSGEMDKFLKEKPDFSVVGEVQKGLDGTGLEDALKKLKGQSVDLNSIEKILNFGMKVREVKKQSVDTIKQVLDLIENLKVGLKKAKSMMKKSRHRRSLDELKRLKDSKTIALDLGKGVNLLRKLADAYEKRNLIQTIAEYPVDVDRELKFIPALESLWSKEAKKSMKEMTPELEEIEKCAQKNKDNKDLIQVGSVFSKASEIRGVPIDTKIFNSNFLEELKKSHSSILQNAGQTFSELSTLELDYSTHRTSIKAASLSLLPLREYFDEVFGISRTSNGEIIGNKEGQNGISQETLLYICGAIAFVVLVVGGAIYFIYKCRRDHKYFKRLRDPETWVLLAFTEENVPVEFGNGFAIKAYHYIIKNNYGAFRNSLKKGAYVDAKVQSHKQSNTMLHEAVIQGRPRFVEALIKHGATRDILNHEYETPYQLAVRLKKKSCIKVFKKYEKKTFKIVLPEPVAKHDYTIKVERGIPEEEHYHGDFFKKFGQYRTEGMKRPTHYVAKTDKKGVLHVEEHHLPHIFSASMIMGHRWLKACLDNSSKIAHNQEYRVTKMKFRGKEYKNLLEIKDFINRMNVPYMFGIGVSYNNNTLTEEWGTLRVVTGQLGVFVGTGDFPFVKESQKRGTTYHRDDLSRNFLIYRKRDRTQVEMNFKSTWIENSEFWFANTDEFIDYLLSFKIISKQIAKVDAKSKDNKAEKPGNKKKKKSIEESQCSNSGPENSDSGTSAIGGTPTSRTPGSRTPASRTPGSRTPRSRTP
ncbi:unnamed protein product [Caenorhabditis nigoni]